MANALVGKKEKDGQTLEENEREWTMCHWPKMADDETEVIILSDCLYYSSQELPLAKTRRCG